MKKNLKLNTKNLKLKLDVLKVVEQSDVSNVVGGGLPGDMVGV